MREEEEEEAFPTAKAASAARILRRGIDSFSIKIIFSLRGEDTMMMGAP